MSIAQPFFKTPTIIQRDVTAQVAPRDWLKKTINHMFTSRDVMTDVDLFKQQKLVNSFLKSCRFFSLPTHSCYAKHTYFFVSLFGNIKVRQKS